jgi:hypothetical protein
MVYRIWLWLVNEGMGWIWNCTGTSSKPLSVPPPPKQGAVILQAATQSEQSNL